jgi:cephalosporin hydroxylase
MVDPVHVVNDFHRLYYSDGTSWQETWWLGTRTLKCPLDLWMYQEIVYRTRPDVILETGTAHGGSALFLASVFDQIGSGEVVTADIDNAQERRDHHRITYLTGSSVDARVLEAMCTAASGRRTMVILDSDHSAAHVAAELACYAPLVTEGCYLIVEDTNVNGHPVLPNFGPGPAEALQDFLAREDRFEVDTACEKHRLTLNPGGYLRRI